MELAWRRGLALYLAEFGRLLKRPGSARFTRAVRCSSKEAGVGLNLESLLTGDVVVIRCQGRIVLGAEIDTLQAELDRQTKLRKRVVLQLAETITLTVPEWERCFACPARCGPLAGMSNCAKYQRLRCGFLKPQTCRAYF